MIPTQPFRIDSTGDVHADIGFNLFTSEIEQLIMTRRSGHGHVGELPWDPYFGSLVTDMLHDSSSLTTQKARVIQYIREALSSYPSYIIKNISVDIENVYGTKKVTAIILYESEGVEKEYSLNLS